MHVSLLMLKRPAVRIGTVSKSVSECTPSDDGSPAALNFRASSIEDRRLRGLVSLTHGFIPSERLGGARGKFIGFPHLLIYSK